MFATRTQRVAQLRPKGALQRNVRVSARDMHPDRAYQEHTAEPLGKKARAAKLTP